MDVYKSTHTAGELHYALGAVPSIGENGNWWIGDQDTGIFAAGVNVTGAEVGQGIKVAEVDENGRPTAWIPADLTGAWTYVKKIKLEEEVASLVVNEDDEGNPLNLQEALVIDKIKNILGAGSWMSPLHRTFTSDGEFATPYYAEGVVHCGADAYACRMVRLKIEEGKLISEYIGKTGSGVDYSGVMNCKIHLSNWLNNFTGYYLVDHLGHFEWPFAMPAGTEIWILGR